MVVKLNLRLRRKKRIFGEVENDATPNTSCFD